jgi:hypothetical protein
MYTLLIVLLAILALHYVVEPLFSTFGIVLWPLVGLVAFGFVCFVIISIVSTLDTNTQAAVLRFPAMMLIIGLGYGAWSLLKKFWKWACS